MRLNLYLFPFRARIYGLLLILAALLCAYFYFLGGRPEFFNIPVFAVVSVYLEARYFVWAQTNLLDELAAIFFILGVAVISFSKEKVEREIYSLFRVKALYYSVVSTLILWIFCFLLIYGMAIFVVSSLIFVAFFVIYNFIFQFYLFKIRGSERVKLKF